MPAGLKQTSSVVAIGFQTIESAANTLTQSSVDLNLSPLDREVFVVLAVNLDPYFPEVITGTDTSVNAALTTTSQTTLPEISDSNCIAKSTHYIAAGAAPGQEVGFSQAALETPPSTLEYIGIIATNDFFVQVKGVGNTTAKGINGKLYGYRARADASIYSALVQSEVLSA
ncbi:MAG: hypothetical protein [Circular genetic element sp.]|nr:MAG: hypothetical protein [Circular genetic element sp.]